MKEQPSTSASLYTDKTFLLWNVLEEKLRKTDLSKILQVVSVSCERGISSKHTMFDSQVSCSRQTSHHKECKKHRTHWGFGVSVCSSATIWLLQLWFGVWGTGWNQSNLENNTFPSWGQKKVNSYKKKKAKMKQDQPFSLGPQPFHKTRLPAWLKSSDNTFLVLFSSLYSWIRVTLSPGSRHLSPVALYL